MAWRKRLTGETLTPVEIEALRNFIKKNFTEDIWDALGYGPDDYGIREIFDEHCSDVESVVDCYQILKDKFSLYLKEEVREREEIERYKAYEELIENTEYKRRRWREK